MRVTTPDGRLAGRVVAIQDDVLELEREAGEVLTIPRASILGLELSQRPSQKAYGTGVGLIVGVAAALTMGAAANEGGAATCVAPPPGTPPRPCNDTSRSEPSWLMLLSIPVGTALLGYAIAPGEKWRATGLTELSVRIGPAPGGGAALSLVVGF